MNGQIESLIGPSGYRGQMDEYLNDLTDQNHRFIISVDSSTIIETRLIQK